MKHFSKIICLTAEAKVCTPSGEMTIDSIEPGMEIIGYDILSASCITDKVYKIAHSLHNCCAKVAFINGVSLVLTLDHPIYVEDRGWCIVSSNDDKNAYGVSVKQLNVGDVCILYFKGGVTHTKVISIDIMQCSEDFYCFSTLKSHSFFANGILVHDMNLDFLTQEQLEANHVIMK